MRLQAISLGLLLTLTSLACSSSTIPTTSSTTPPAHKLSRQVLEDKIRGGWAGKMIGVSYGAPTEFRSNAKINESELTWSPDRVSNSIGQDDLYVGMTMAETMDRLGLEATAEQYGEAFKDSKYSLWHANAGARRLLNAGIKAPMSGHPKYNIHANDIDFQIEADFIGLMSPGLPQESNKYCDRVGRVMNYGDGLYGGMFISGMYTAAFLEKDPHKVVEQGLACLPSQSSYAQLIQDVLNWHQQNPNDWKKNWQLIEEKWDKDDPCPDGALQPFNIDARLNGAYIVLGLIYGDGDFSKTLEISTRAGQDSDCNPSTAGGILGVIIGYAGIPDQWKSGIPTLADTKFQFTNSSLNDICRSTMNRALKLVQQAGGKVTDTEVEIPAQSPKPPELEQWDMGVPDKRFGIDDKAWNWQGNWAKVDVRRGAAKTATGPGPEVTLSFTGSAVALVGNYTQEGGRADVFLDGEKAQMIDAYVVPDTHDNDLWHAYDLKPGPHTLRVVLRDDADSRSKGKKLMISSAVAYRAR
jgi:hypothetical protein